jgi:pyrroline-5-carboxylate reductase
VTDDNRAAASAAPTVLLAVKPQNLEAVGGDLNGNLASNTLVISILAGASIAKIRKNLGEGLPVVRVMPNLPALIGCGMAGIAAAPGVSDEQRTEARRMLQTVGKVVELPEDQIDAVTALSGSGPGFVFRLMEAFTAAGESIGLSQEAAELLTRQTFLGAARLIDETGEKAADLRAKVSSPGGTTLAGLGVMEEKGIEDLVRATLEAARDRARELGG